MNKGLFISIEGVEAAGKTLLIKKISDFLNNEGIPFVQTKEPGGTKISQKIREMLLDPANLEMHRKTEIMLYASSRAQLVHELINPSLEEGKIVLCDRYMDSSLAYQGYGLEHSPKDINMIKQISMFAADNLLPDRTYLLDLPIEESFRRMGMRSIETGTELDRIEQRTIDFHKRVRAGFHQIAQKEPERFKIIDSTMSPNAVFSVVKNDLQHFLK